MLALGPSGSCTPVAPALRNLAVTQTVTPARVRVGRAEMYSVTVRNTTNGYVNDVPVTHRLPEGSTFVDATVTPLVVTPATLLDHEFVIPAIAPGHSAT